MVLRPIANPIAKAIITSAKSIDIPMITFLCFEKKPMDGLPTSAIIGFTIQVKRKFFICNKKL
jgi:hypothetical protein